MKFPTMRSSLSERLQYFGYVRARVIRAGYTDLVAPLDSARTAMKRTADAVEDLEVKEQECVANRNAGDDELDDLARYTRIQLAGREVDAIKKAPYLFAFPKGVKYYVEADLDEQVTRFEELAGRLEDSLPAGDPLLPTAGQIRTGLIGWSADAATVADARQELARARTRRDDATRSFIETIESTYGTLVNRVGRAKAARFFPSSKGKAKAKAAPEVEPEDEPAVAPTS
jgi:hypothetical protein